MDKFEQWFINQDFYTNMRFIHGDGLFIKDGEVYRVLPVQMAWMAWQSRQAEIDEKDKRIKEALVELESLHDKKWAEWKEQADMHSQGEANAYEHAMRILEKALRGEHE